MFRRSDLSLTGIPQMECRYGYICAFLSESQAPARERAAQWHDRRRFSGPRCWEGKYALKWTRLSCKSFAANEVRLQLHALAYNLANFLRTLVLPAAIADWSLTSLRERMIKIGTKAISHARSIILQLADVAVPRSLWSEMLANISNIRARAQAQ